MPPESTGPILVVDTPWSVAYPAGECTPHRHPLPGAAEPDDLQRVMGRAIQAFDALGITDDTPALVPGPP